MPLTLFAPLTLSIITVLIAMSLTSLAASRAGRWSVIDVTWGLGFVAIALVNRLTVTALNGHAALGRPPAEQARVDALERASNVRGWVLVLLVSLWGLRLAWHIYRRSIGHGEDPRYEAIKARNPSYARAALIPQGVIMLFVSLPVIVGIWLSNSLIGPLFWIGLAVYAIGLCFEVVGDAQLAAYKRDPGRGPVMDRGLWAWTRHPNYFGDACMWWGIWLLAADGGIAPALTVLSPVLMTYFLVFVSGAKLLEKSMMKRPGYPEYAARTSMFFPLPPKRSS